MIDSNPATAIEEKTGQPAEFARGATVGRYLVVALIGKGGMGEVYAAYDPELDRKIALKLLRANTSAGVDPSEGRARLLREAQAIARLSDPNVVVVFDVGTFGDRVFLAMEFVDGNTLSYWLEAKQRTWREIVATFAAAGRGLASAHRAGVVHRDFKPDNVMIGRDNKVRVMDFGLARSIDSTETPAPALAAVPAAAAAAVPAVPAMVGVSTPVPPHAGVVRASARTADSRASTVAAWTDGDTVTRDLSREAAGLRSDIPASPMNSRLTVTGALMGTPAYMAPEQFQGVKVDARTDQFSFCVAVYEGLYGERPFEGRNINELSANVKAGHVRQPPTQPRVPGWLRRVVLRGLRVDPGERHASMDALLVALARDPARSRRRWAAAATVVSMFAVLGAGLVRAERQQRVRCLGADAKLAGIWELPSANGLSPRKQAIRRAFMATGKRYAADSFTVVTNALDRYVTEWNNMHREACEATNIRGEQSAEVLDLRMSCLHDRFSEVRALTNVFSDASGDVVAKSAEAAQALRPVEQCADIAALRAVVRPPDDPNVRRAVADVRTQLADVKALAAAGRFKRALKEAPGIVVNARQTNYHPLIAEAVLQLGELQSASGDSRQAEENYEDAILLAEESRHDEVVVEAETELIYHLGFSQERYVEAQRWAKHATAVLQRLGPGHEVLAAWRWNNLAVVYESEGRLKESLAAHREALTLKKGVLGEQHFDVAITLMNIATVLAELGNNVAAMGENNRALAILKNTMGTEHPYFASCLSNGAEFANAAGLYSEAQAKAEQALRIWQAELGADHPNLAFPLTALGRSLIGQKKSALAIQILERALAIRERNNQRSSWLGETRFALAQAIADINRSDREVRALARSARSDFQSSPSTKDRVAAVDLWLESLTSVPQHVSMR